MTSCKTHTRLVIEPHGGPWKLHPIGSICTIIVQYTMKGLDEGHVVMTEMTSCVYKE